MGEALGEEVHVRGSKIVALGIAPWGVVQQRSMLIGIDVSLLSPIPFSSFFVLFPTLIGLQSHLCKRFFSHP